VPNGASMILLARMDWEIQLLETFSSRKNREENKRKGNWPIAHPQVKRRSQTNFETIDMSRYLWKYLKYLFYFP
jgi:hypothetical protein